MALFQKRAVKSIENGKAYENNFENPKITDSFPLLIVDSGSDDSLIQNQELEFQSLI